MGQEGLVNKAEAGKMLKTDEIIESIRYVNDNVSGLRNRIHSACDRVGVQFDPRDELKESPPSYGSLPQIHEQISDISRVIAECHEFMVELERFV